MYYQATITVPANTPERSPVITTLTLTVGVIKRLLVAFPPGCAGLCHILIREKGWQIAPWSLGESFSWNDYVFEMSPDYPMTAEPYDLTIHGWNLDDSYEHTVFVGCEVVGEELKLEERVGALLLAGMGETWLTK